MIYKNKINQIREKEAIRIQYTKELAEVEMKALRAQINPHFLFNSLNSINNFILRNDTKLASRYLVKFSQLVRNILNNSSATFINLEEELQTIELYMIIEGMRFSNQFSYQIVFSPEIQPGSIRIPSLLLQPYVENAIWHGLLHKDGEKNIVISVKRNDQQYICIEIEDNGVGREKARQLESKTKKHKSFGMALGESRLRLMNLGSTPQSSVEVADLHNVDGEATGTKIIITLFDAKFNQSILNQ
jgi:sensor histidine kinase YesM